MDTTGRSMLHSMWCCARSHIAMEPSHLFRANILCDQPYKSGENLQKSVFGLILYASDYLTTAWSANFHLAQNTWKILYIKIHNKCQTQKTLTLGIRQKDFGGNTTSHLSVQLRKQITFGQFGVPAQSEVIWYGEEKKTDWSIQHIYEEEETIKKLFSQAAFPFDMSRYCTVGRWCCCPWYHQSAKVFHPFWHRQGTHQSPSEYKWYSFWCHIINLPSLLTMTGHTPKSIWIQILQLLMPRHQWEATWKTLLFL